MELADLHEVIWGEGYELYYVDDEAIDPAYVGHFGYDDVSSNLSRYRQSPGLVPPISK